jgi:PAS domain S-box-containing protein
MKKDKVDILLVEDDEGHAELIHRAFDGYSDRYRLHTVSTLEKAREFVEATPPHLLITDLILPDGKGIELLVPGEESRQFPLVVMTGYGDEQVAVDSLKAGALDYVVKLEASLRGMPRIADRVLRDWEHIVERKRAEKALAESEEKFRALIENASDLIVILDEAGSYLYLSPAVADITGFSEEELIGKIQSDFLHPDDKDMVERIMEQVKSEEGVTQPIPNFRLRHQEGHWVNLEGMVTNMLNVPGVNGIVVNCRDVTELRQMEESLNRMQKLESIGLLAGGIAHDYNNLLTIILGNLAVAKMADSVDKRLGALEEAEKGVLKARDLTQQLLTFAKGGAPVKETASIMELLKDSADFSLRGSNVSMEMDLQEDLHPVDVDKGQISQVIHNLVLNADQAMPHGGVLTIKARNVVVEEDNVYGLSAGDYIKIEIIDRGIGISSKYKEKVFDPYFTTKSKGSGLGLSIVYSIVRKHNGCVDLLSQPGKGTTFYIYLPASEGEVEEFEMMEDALHGEGKILVVDDEESIREVAALLLETLGYTVTLAETGEEAVNMCKRSSFDAVIMDLTIPGGMGGKEAAKEIRQFDKDIQLIVSSGYSNDPVMARYKDYGFNGVLMKPYKLEQVGEVLYRLLNPD